LVCVGSSEEQARKIIAEWPPGDGDTSRLGSRELMNDEIKCSLHGARRARRIYVQGAGAMMAAQ
jgi:hypothetical protein